MTAKQTCAAVVLRATDNYRAAVRPLDEEAVLDKILKKQRKKRVVDADNETDFW